jgi:hypothetical protein
MDEVDDIDAMQQLRDHVAVDMELVGCGALGLARCDTSKLTLWLVFVPCCLQTRRRACVSADDEQQLLEVQAELLSDFLAELPSLQHSRLRSLLSPPMDDSIQDNNDTSLQFAWDTIHEQKKEIIRLRAENDELKRQGDERAAKMSQSLFSDDKKPRAQSIDLLRSQISSHHDNNVSMLHEHIHNLEKALHRATSSATSVSKDKRRGPRFDASSSTVNSSRDNDGATSTAPFL